MADRSVAIRLGVQDDGVVRAALESIADTGDASAKRLASSYGRAAADADAALQRLAAQQAKVAAFTPVSFSSGANSSNLDRLAGVNDNVGKSAESSSAIFEAAYKRMEDRATALTAAIDPAFAAQQRFDQTMSEARTLFNAGALSAERYEQVQKDATVTLNRAAEGHARLGTSGMIAEHVVRSLSDSVAAGQSPLTALTMETGRITEGLTLWAQNAENTEGVMGKFAAFMGGPWGLAISAAIAVGSTLISTLLSTADASDKDAGASKNAASAMREFQQRQSDIGNFIDATTGRLKEQNVALVRNAILLRQSQIDDNNAKVRAGTTTAFNRARIASGDSTSIYSGGAQSSSAINPYTGKPNGPSAYGGGLDPALSSTVRAAGGDVQKLDAGLAALAARRPDLRDTIRSVSDAAAQTVVLSRENHKLAGEIDQLNGKTTTQVHVTADAIERQVRLATATTAVERARASYDIVRARGDSAQAAGGAALEQYRRDLTAAASAVNGAEAAEKAATASRHAHTAEVRDGAKAAREAAAATREYLKAEQDLINFVNKGGVEVGDILAKHNKDQTTFSDGGALDRGTDDAAARIKVDTEAWSAEYARRQQMQENGIRTVSGLYQDLFRGGTKSIFNDFVQMGENAIAQLLAKWTVGQLSGSGVLGTIGKLFGLAGSASGGFDASAIADSATSAVTAALPHNATGTDYSSGGATWVAENGPEIVNLPRGSSVVPAAQTRQMLAGNDNAPAVHNHFDLRGALVTQDVLDQMNAIGNGAAARGAAGGAQLAGVQAGRARRRQLGRRG